MSGSADVVIIGAGIVGAACALECAQRGLRTVIVEQSTAGGGTTAAGMGHIVVMDDSPAQMALTRYSQQLWRSLADRLPASVEFDPCGTIWVAADEEEMTEVRRKHAFYAAAGIPTEILDAQALAEAEPHLRRPLSGGLLVPEDAVLYPPAAAAWLMKEGVDAGARVSSPRAVIAAGNGMVRLDDGAELHAAHIVNAAGADAARLTPGLPIRRRKGHLVVTDRYPGFVRHQLVELGYLKSAHSLTADSVAFNVQPRRTGQIIVGSSRQFDADDAAIDHRILTAMIERARMYMPELGSLQAIRVWTGFRAATPDKLPLIGPWPEDETLWLAAGHEGLGITTSLGTAKLLADALTCSASAIPLDPYLPRRYAGTVPHA
jgi:glycine/D-amino acid oxidase-like deaminating enzyme